MAVRTAVAVLAVPVFFLPGACPAAWATDAEMAEQALGTSIGSTGTAAERFMRIQLFHDRLYARAREDPEALGTATIAFSTGQSIPELAQLSEAFDVEVIAINVKAPLTDSGVVQSLLIGSGDLVRSEGSFEARATQILEYYRCEFLMRADVSPPDESRNLKRMATSPMLVYAADMIGSVGSLFALTTHADVIAVAVDRPEKSHAEIASYRRLASAPNEDWHLMRTQLHDPCAPNGSGRGSGNGPS